jgi:hypothetical protein
VRIELWIFGHFATALMATASSRVYFVERLLSFTGYLCLPILFDALSYYLPPFQRALSRFVRIGARAWELWSPNSTAAAFYPGLADGSFELAAEGPVHFRRGDGHLGRFDPTVLPQVLDFKRLWYPFVRRSADLASYPEFTPFLEIWDVRAGAVNPAFIDRLWHRISVVSQGTSSWQALASSHPALWNDRPLRPQRDDVHHLSTLRDFASALDAYTCIQRGAKLTSAWCRMAHFLTSDDSGSASLASVPVADESLMGTWINGSSEEVGMWLLKLCVPCFIIHEQDSEVDWYIGQHAQHRISFVHGTPAEDLKRSPIDAAVLANGGKLLNLAVDRWLALSSPPSLWKDRVRSSSYGQGWRKDTYVPQADNSPDSPFTESNGYLLPPVIAAGRPGSWTHWKEDETLTGDYCFTKTTRAELQRLGGKTYYDRILCRELSFEDSLRRPRDFPADPKIFGYPAPQVVYQEVTTSGEFRICTTSVWLYKDRQAARGDAGKEFHLPAARLTPDREDRMDVDPTPSTGHVSRPEVPVIRHPLSPVRPPPRRAASPRPVNSRPPVPARSPPRRAASPRPLDRRSPGPRDRRWDQLERPYAAPESSRSAYSARRSRS